MCVRNKPRVLTLVHAVPEPHDELLALEPLLEELVGLSDAAQPAQVLHGCLVGAAVQRTTQRPDGGRDARVEVAQRAHCHAGGEGRSVEVVLSVEDEGHVEGARDLWADLVGQVVQFQEVQGDGVVGRGCTAIY